MRFNDSSKEADNKALTLTNGVNVKEVEEIAKVKETRGKRQWFTNQKNYREDENISRSSPDLIFILRRTCINSANDEDMFIPLKGCGSTWFSVIHLSRIRISLRSLVEQLIYITFIFLSMDDMKKLGYPTTYGTLEYPNYEKGINKSLIKRRSSNRKVLLLPYILNLCLFLPEPPWIKGSHLLS